MTQSASAFAVKVSGLGLIAMSVKEITFPSWSFIPICKLTLSAVRAMPLHHRPFMRKFIEQN
jgi:hypothetical protein